MYSEKIIMIQLPMDRVVNPLGVKDTYKDRRLSGRLRRAINPAVSIRRRMLPTVAGSISQ